MRCDAARSCPLAAGGEHVVGGRSLSRHDALSAGQDGNKVPQRGVGEFKSHASSRKFCLGRGPSTLTRRRGVKIRHVCRRHRCLPHPIHGVVPGQRWAQMVLVMCEQRDAPTAAKEPGTGLPCHLCHVFSPQTGSRRRRAAAGNDTTGELGALCPTAQMPGPAPGKGGPSQPPAAAARSRDKKQAERTAVKRRRRWRPWCRQRDRPRPRRSFGSWQLWLRRRVEIDR